MPGTVSSIAKSFPQPSGGFLRPSSFWKLPLSSDTVVLHNTENLSSGLVGTVVDSMTRFMISHDAEKSFDTQIKGLRIAYGDNRSTSIFLASLLSAIKSLDDESLRNACILARYETWYRNTAYAKSVSPSFTGPDADTLDNIRVMVNRNLEFFDKNGPVTSCGFDFLPEGGSVEEEIRILRSGAALSYGGYTRNVAAGDGDYLTADGLWDMKVSKGKLTSKQTLQILIYWIMGWHSGKEEFINVTKIGIINPRLNVAYVKDVGDIDPDVIAAVEQDVIGYH